MNKLLCIVLMCVSFCVCGQSLPFIIEGDVVASEDNLPINSATVFLQRAKDSSLVTYTITDANGHFKLENKAFHPLNELLVTHIAYETYRIPIDLLEFAVLSLDTIKLRPKPMQLNEVVVKAEVPITIKQDTLEFNANSFKTKKDATVEDLLKELPGVEINEDGTIKINGKPVNKILVNGKPFFGNDPTITTRNLTKEIIKKVQVTDSKTKSENFL